MYITFPLPSVRPTSCSPTIRPAWTTSLDTWVTAKLGSAVVVSKVTTLMPRFAACSSGAWRASASVAATISASGCRATAAFTIGICEAGSYFGGACCSIETPSRFASSSAPSQIVWKKSSPVTPGMNTSS